MEERQRQLEEKRSKKLPESWGEAFQSIKITDITNVATTPCARQALLYGISFGFLLGILQFTLKASPKKIGNYFVGGTCGVSVIMFEGCRWKRLRELSRMKVIIEEIASKQREKSSNNKNLSS